MRITKLSLNAAIIAGLARESHAFQHSSKSVRAGVFGTRSIRNLMAFTPERSSKKANKKSLNMSTIASVDAAKLEDVSASYKELTDKLKTITQLRRASAVLDYDRMVLMPTSGDAAAARGAQQAALASIIHEKATCKSIPELISKAKDDIENCKTLDAVKLKDELRILELTEKSYEKNARIPAELESRRAELMSSAYAAWTKSRAESDFSMFSEKLKECFDISKEMATYHRGDATISLYTQMLDEFEMGMKAERM